MSGPNLRVGPGGAAAPEGQGPEGSGGARGASGPDAGTGGDRKPPETSREESAGRPGRRPGRRPGGSTPVIAALSALAAGLALARQAAHGAAFSHDGINYLAIARHLLAGEGFADVDGAPSTLWPPLYPLALAAFGLLGLDPEAVAGPLGAAALGLTVFVVGRHLDARLESGFLRLWAPAALALSLPLADLASRGLSDPLCILFVVLTLVSTDRYLEGGGRRRLAAAAGFGALATLARYPGAAAVAAAAGALLLTKGAPFGRRVRRCAGFLAAASAPMALWLLRNYAQTGMLTGHRRRPGYYDLGDLFRDGLGDLAAWLEFDFGLLTLSAAAFAAVLTAFPAAFPAGGSSTRSSLDPPPGAEAAPARRPVRSPAALFGAFGLLHYAVVMLSVGGGGTLSGLKVRFLTPLFVAFVVVAAAGCDRLLRAERARSGISRRRRRLLPGLLAGLLSAWLFGQAAPGVRAIRRANAEDTGLDRGIRAEVWRNSGILEFLRGRARLPDRIYSNEPLLAYFATGPRTRYRYLPFFPSPEVRVRRGKVVSPQRQFEEWLAAPPAPDGAPEGEAPEGTPGPPDGSWIVWIRDRINGYYPHAPPPPLDLAPALRPIARFADGAAYEVARGAPPRPDRFREAYEAITAGAAGAPLFRSKFDLYRLGGEVAYFAEPCLAEDLSAPFFLHFHPEDPEALPGAFEGRPYRGDFDADALRAEREALPPAAEPPGFLNRDFPFPERGLFVGAACVALVPLPEFPVSRLRTGQWTPGPPGTPGIPGGGALWRAEARFDGEALRSAAAFAASGEPAARSVFDLHLEDLPAAAGAPGRRLIFHRPSCSPEDTRAGFFLHLYPRDRATLPDARRPSGFENRDFRFEARGATVDGACVAVVRLPPRAGRLRAGQWIPGAGDLWSVALALPEQDGARRAED